MFLVNPHVESGKLRAIAVTSAKPDPSLPGVAPLASLGVPGFEAYTWWGVFGPGNMPPAFAKRIYEELAKAAKTPAVADGLAAQGIDVTAAGPAELDAFVRGRKSRAGPRSSRTTTSRAATELGGTLTQKLSHDSHQPLAATSLPLKSSQVPVADAPFGV